MNLKNKDLFSPYILAVTILIFLIMGYYGSLNYRFDSPLSFETISIILYGTFIFLIGVLIARHFINFKENKELSKKIDSIFPEKLLLGVVMLSILLQVINLITMGGIPLFDSVLKSNATTNIWRISYVLYLPFMNFLLAKYYKKRYFILILIGVLIYGLNGYRTSVMAIFISSFIVLYYLKKINKKIAISIILLMLITGLLIGYIASQSIANQHWTLNPLELIFYRSAFTLKVLEKIIPLMGTTNGEILSLVFSSASPRNFIGHYVLHYDVVLTSTIFGPVLLDFGIFGLTVQMLLLGIFLKVLNILLKSQSKFLISIYSICLAHGLIWIETGPTDSMIYIFYMLGIIGIVLSINKLIIINYY